jgi:hypothetical protein
MFNLIYFVGCLVSFYIGHIVANRKKRKVSFAVIGAGSDPANLALQLASFLNDNPKAEIIKTSFFLSGYGSFIAVIQYQ